VEINELTTNHTTKITF